MHPEVQSSPQAGRQIGQTPSTPERQGGAATQLKQQLKGASFAEQEALLAPPESAPPESGGALGPAHGAAQVQRQTTALDVLAIKGGSFAWNYLETLAKHYMLEQAVVDLLKQGLHYLVEKAFAFTGIDAYIAMMAPYLKVLGEIRAVIKMIPQPIQVLLMQGLGWAVRQFSTSYMYGAITEAHINMVLVDGVDYAVQLDSLIGFLLELGTKPTATVSRAIWNVVETVGWSVTGGLRSMYQWVRGGSSEASADGGDSGDDAPSDGPPAQAEAPMADANLGWFWLQAQQPKIARWQDEDGKTERGGLQLDGRFGVKLFGNTMGADAVRLQVPYGGGFNVDLNNISLLSNPITLGKVFRGGPILIERMSFGDRGLTHMKIVARDFSFGDGVVTAPELSMEYKAGDGTLEFAGSTALNAFGHTVEGQLGLTVGTDGSFKGGRAALSSPDTFSLFDDRLALKNAFVSAEWYGSGEDKIEIGGDLGLNLYDSVQLASETTRIRYQRGLGFQGQVARAWLNAPVHKGGTLRFELLEGLISRDGFKAQKISLIYAYGAALDDQQAPGQDGQAAETQPQDAPRHGAELDPATLSQLVPGFNLDWIGHSGLETLVVNLSASDVNLDSAGLSIGELKKELARFKASVFGIGAEFDSKERRGAISGHLEHKIQPVRVAAAFPIVPGVHAGLSFATELGVNADLNLAAQRRDADPSQPDLHPWDLSGKAGIGAHAGLEMAAEIGVGVPMLAELNGGLFARASIGVSAEAQAKGTIFWDDKKHRVTVPEKAADKPSAEIAFKVSPKAELGAQVRASLFFNMIDKQLWSYRFLEWQMGDWQLAGRLEATDGGGYEFKQTRMGFEGKDGLPRTQPIVEQKRVRADEMIAEAKASGSKLTDEGQVWRLVHELQSPGNQLPRAQRMALFNDLRELNKSGLDLDGAAMEVLDLAKQRVMDGADELSLLMTREEWVKYSTTVKSGEKRTERKSILPIDQALAAYHRAPPEERLTRLDEIQALIARYNDQWFVSRKDMARKLDGDVQRERTRLQLGQEAKAKAQA